MVLQQQSEVTFSGTATSGKRVQATASWNNKKIQTNVDAKGEWKLSLQTPVAGGPYSIRFLGLLLVVVLISMLSPSCTAIS